jgi:hypothetical protein
MGLVLLILIGTAGFWSYNQRVQNPAPVPLPERIADLPLTQSLQAEEAVAEVSRLHWDDIPLSSGAVGMYGTDHSITLWVAGASYQTMADRMMVAMREKIARPSGNTPFSPVGEHQVGSRTLYELDGMSQKHFYFQSGKLIVWLAADPERAEEATAQTLEFYP